MVVVAAAALTTADVVAARAVGEDFAALPDPVIPPVAPEVAIRAEASASVVQAIDVPGELTSGRAKQLNVAEQAVVTNFPLTHCAKLVPTHAFSPPMNRNGFRLVRVLPQL